MTARSLLLHQPVESSTDETIKSYQRQALPHGGTDSANIIGTKGGNVFEVNLRL